MKNRSKVYRDREPNKNRESFIFHSNLKTCLSARLTDKELEVLVEKQSMEVSTESTKLSCEQCGQSPVSSFCEDDKGYYCGACVEIHKAGKRTARHQLRELITLQVHRKLMCER